eukprot:SAG31_NODE_17429_length_671_cov_0.620629_1_plen_84_part_10
MDGFKLDAPFGRDGRLRTAWAQHHVGISQRWRRPWTWVRRPGQQQLAVPHGASLYRLCSTSTFRCTAPFALMRLVASGAQEEDA